MLRYAVVKEVKIYSHEDTIGTISYDEGLGYKAKLEDSFMSKEDICFVGKVMDFLAEHEDDLLIEEKI